MDDTAQRADKLLLLARTTPRDQCKRAFDGITLFYTDLDRNKVEIREIAKMGRKCVDTNALLSMAWRYEKKIALGKKAVDSTICWMA